jgi:hypothetical protein
MLASVSQTPRLYEVARSEKNYEQKGENPCQIGIACSPYVLS